MPKSYVEWIQRATKEAEQLMSKHDILDWVTLQRSRLWRWAGRVALQDDERWSHEVLHWEPLGSRVRGRPRTRWTDQIIPFLQHKLGRDLGPMEWITVARQKATWDMWADDFLTFTAEPC